MAIDDLTRVFIYNTCLDDALINLLKETLYFLFIFCISPFLKLQEIKLK